MAAQHLEAEARAVRHAPHVHLVVAERGPQVVDVVGAGAGVVGSEVDAVRAVHQARRRVLGAALRQHDEVAVDQRDVIAERGARGGEPLDHALAVTARPAVEPHGHATGAPGGPAAEVVQRDAPGAGVAILDGDQVAAVIVHALDQAVGRGHVEAARRRLDAWHDAGVGVGRGRVDRRRRVGLRRIGGAAIAGTSTSARHGCDEKPSCQQRSHDQNASAGGTSPRGRAPDIV
jgi:hypothetical protein